MPSTAIYIHVMVTWDHLLEIFSLGRTFYPGEENKNMVDVLKDGKRLSKPVLHVST